MKKKYKKKYWKAVFYILLEWNFSKKIAEKGIKRYRKAMKKAKVGLMLYHSSIEDTASGIISGEYIAHI